MKSYLGMKLSKEFDEAKEAGTRLADLFYEFIYNGDTEDDAEESRFYISSPGKDYDDATKMSILPKKILEEEIGLSFVSWQGGEVILKWSGK